MKDFLKLIIALLITACFISMAIDFHKFVAIHNEINELKEKVKHLREITWCLEPAQGKEVSP